MKVIVIGGGPAGMMAALKAAESGAEVLLLEKNEKIGKKLYITGKGRCNVTNACDREDLLKNVVRNPRFLYSAFAAFDNRDLMDLLQKDLHVPLKVERGNRVFPESDKSSDIIRAMDIALRNAGVKILLNTLVSSLIISEGAVTGVMSGSSTYLCDAVILAAGGCSYPQTGSDGAGVRMAAGSGHRTETPMPALVPLETVERWPTELSGISLKNVTLTAKRGKKVLFSSEPGELLFTHFGVSGPLVLSLSSVIARDPAGAELQIDLKCGLTAEQLDKRILRELDENKGKQIEGALHALLPGRLLAAVLKAAGIPTDTRADCFTKEQRARLVSLLKALPLTVRGARPMDEAIITSGGVSVRDVDPKTMGSKVVRGLFFAGEILDVDAYTGGFNLQIAWSTGALAGRSCVL